MRSKWLASMEGVATGRVSPALPVRQSPWSCPNRRRGEHPSRPLVKTLAVSGRFSGFKSYFSDNSVKIIKKKSGFPQAKISDLKKSFALSNFFNNAECCIVRENQVRREMVGDSYVEKGRNYISAREMWSFF